MIPLYYNVRSLAARRLSTGLTVLGLSLVVFVFAAVLMLSNGIESALSAGGSRQNAVLLREGALTEIGSVVPREAVAVVGNWPQVASSPEGTALAAGELLVIVALPRDGDTFANISARGVTGPSWEARPAARITEGRQPRPGSFEIALGSSLIGAGSGAEVGGELEFAGQRWPVVGRLSAGGGAFESEIWADRNRLGQAFNRPGLTSAIVRLTSPDAFPELKRRIEGDRRFELKAMREDEYWEEQASATATFIRVLGLFVAFVFSIGAVLGAMITMFAQVSARIRELGAMRAIGFARGTVLAGVVIESALLGAVGGLLGSLGATAMRFVKIETLNFATFSQISFGFAPTPGILLAALLFGLGMGVSGGILPALKAARLGILDAVRA